MGQNPIALDPQFDVGGKVPDAHQRVDLPENRLKTRLVRFDNVHYPYQYSRSLTSLNDAKRCVKIFRMTGSPSPSKYTSTANSSPVMYSSTRNDDWSTTLSGKRSRLSRRLRQCQPPPPSNRHRT